MSRPIYRKAFGVPPVKAFDGGTVYEIFGGEDVADGAVGLAKGRLDHGESARPHFHRLTDEIYYVLSGRGVVHVGGTAIHVDEEDSVLVPKGSVHWLRNLTNEEPLNVLCISCPAFSKADCYFP